MTVKLVGDYLDPGAWKWVSQSSFLFPGEEHEFYQPTAIGLVGATSRGTIAIGPEDAIVDTVLHLSVEQAYDLIKALSAAAYAADRKRESLSGFNTLCIRKVDGAYEGKWRGITVLLRRSVLRRERRCEQCKQDVMALWVAVESPRAQYAPRTGFVETCDACVERLAAAPTGLRRAK